MKIRTTHKIDIIFPFSKNEVIKRYVRIMETKGYINVGSFYPTEVSDEEGDGWIELYKTEQTEKS